MAGGDRGLTPGWRGAIRFGEMGTVTTSVALAWRPAPYEVRWAHEPSEVPAFDPSRGGDPYFPAPAEDSERVGFRFIPWDLGGGQPPPGLEGSVTVEEIDQASGDLMVYDIPVRNYPRLVRATSRDVGVVPGDLKPLEELADLSRHNGDADLMERVRVVMERFGPLAYGTFDFTLEAWMDAAIELLAHLQLLRQLAAIAEAEDRSERVIRLDADHRRALQACIASIRGPLAIPDASTMRGVIEDAETLRAVREQVTSLYWKEFVRSSKPHAHPGAWFRQPDRASWGQVNLVDLGDATGQVVVRCGCRGWSFHELWEEATRHALVHLCQGCGRLFVAGRKDARHCSDACRVKSFRRRRDGARRIGS